MQIARVDQFTNSGTSGKCDTVHDAKDNDKKDNVEIHTYTECMCEYKNWMLCIYLSSLASMQTQNIKPSYNPARQDK